MSTVQKALTPKQYAALGYVQREDFDPTMFNVEPDKPLSRGFDFPAYRAETQEEAIFDIGLGIFKVGVSFASGGAWPAAQTALGYTLKLVNESN